jgi:hypothetical protein
MNREQLRTACKKFLKGGSKGIFKVLVSMWMMATVRGHSSNQ